MNIQFTMGTIWTLILSALLCLIAPIVFLFRYRKRYDGKITSFFIGMAGYFLFSMLLIQLIHMIMFSLIPAIPKLISEKAWFQSLYLAFSFTLFGCLGRFLMLKYSMKNRFDLGNALIYGAGQGGLFAITNVTAIAMSNVITAILVNTLGADEYLNKLGYTGTDLENIRIHLIEFSSMPTTQHFFDGTAPFIILFAEIALTTFIYLGIQKQKATIFLAISFLFQFIILFSFYLEKTNVITEPLFAEGVILLVTVTCWHYAKKAESLI